MGGTDGMCNIVHVEGNPAVWFPCRRKAGHSGRHSYGIVRPLRGHSGYGNVHCDICAPMTCTRAK